MFTYKLIRIAMRFFSFWLFTFVDSKCWKNMKFLFRFKINKKIMQITYVKFKLLTKMLLSLQSHQHLCNGIDSITTWFISNTHVIEYWWKTNIWLNFPSLLLCMWFSQTKIRSFEFKFKFWSNTYLQFLNIFDKSLIICPHFKFWLHKYLLAAAYFNCF